MKDLVTRLADSVAGLILLVALGFVVVAIFGVLVVALNWLIIPVLLIVGAIIWLSRDNIKEIK